MTINDRYSILNLLLTRNSDLEIRRSESGLGLLVPSEPNLGRFLFVYGTLPAHFFAKV